MAAALPLAVLLGLVLLGLLQARANADDPAALRYQAWQLLGGGLVLLLLVAHTMLGTPLPHVDPKIAGLVLALVLALVVLLRKRGQAAGGADF